MCNSFVNQSCFFKTRNDFNIEIISGLEEARLIYKGVAQFLPRSEERRLVVDIGGGSTECIIGHDLEVLQADSFYMGCVEFTNHFFPKRSWSHSDFQAAVTSDSCLKIAVRP